MSSKKSSLKGAGAPTAVPAAAPSKPAPAPTFGVPNRVGSLNFCPTCGNLLDIPGDDDTITCVQCGHTEDAVQYENISIVTRSHPDAFPSPLKDKRSVVQSLSSNKELQDQLSTKQEINEKCPDCGHPTMTFHTLQLRSADEGSTVFYECQQCGHKHSTNN